MYEFMTDLRAIITPIFSKAYQDIAQSDQTTPYVIFNALPGGEEIGDSSKVRQFTLELTIHYSDTDGFETITDKIDELDAALDQKCFNGTEYFARLWFESRTALPEQDNEFRQRQLIYNLYYTTRS